MKGCGRQFCPRCGEELIHRDHRRPWESSSTLGQIVWREGPSGISATDVDLLMRKSLVGQRHLIRLIEQKQPSHRLDTPQAKTLRVVGDALAHCVTCPAATSLGLHPYSGLYIVRGELGAATAGQQETRFIGPQEIEYPTGATRIVENEEQFFMFLDPFDKNRRLGGLA